VTFRCHLACRAGWARVRLAPRWTTRWREKSGYRQSACPFSWPLAKWCCMVFMSGRKGRTNRASECDTRARQRRAMCEVPRGCTPSKRGPCCRAWIK